MTRSFLHKLVCSLACTTLLGAGASQAQPYPSKPITLVVPFSAGSGTDQVARGMSQVIGAELKGATIVVDNKPGASGMIAAQAVARAPAEFSSVAR